MEAAVEKRGSHMKVIEKMNNFFRTFCTILLILMTCLVIFQVLSRKFFKFSVAQVEEIARYCMIWVGLLGAAIGISTKSHVAVEILRDMFSFKYKKAAVLVTDLVMALFFVILLVYGIKLSNQAMTQSSPSMPFLKMGFIMAGVPLTGIVGLINIVDIAIKEAREKPADSQV